MRGLAVLVVLAGTPAGADCRLALALAFDVSRSVNGDDYRIQQGGLIDALADPGIRAAFLVGEGPVALAVYEWSGRSQQEIVADWRLIEAEADLDAVSALVAARRLPEIRHATALGRALDYGRQLMLAAPPCRELVIDVSGDGQNNEGYSPAEVYGFNDWGAIRVNALAIGEHESGLVDYFTREVIRGPGAFVEIAPKQVDFPDAMRRKLMRELSAAMLGDAGARGAGDAG